VAVGAQLACLNILIPNATPRRPTQATTQSDILPTTSGLSNLRSSLCEPARVQSVSATPARRPDRIRSRCYTVLWTCVYAGLCLDGHDAADGDKMPLSSLARLALAEHHA
jgi:hypothetical protein